MTSQDAKLELESKLTYKLPL